MSSSKVDLKLEVIVIPVANVERAKHFYAELGWRLDADFRVGDLQLVQFTPPGSPCSIHFGTGLSAAAPGSASGMYLIVSDIEAARASLTGLGVKVSEVFHREGPGKPPINGRHPQGNSYSSFATFADPDGNTWLLQEVTTRFPGRVDTNQATYTSPGDLAAALKRAETAHGAHERLTGERDADWPAWYAEYLFREQSGQPLPT